MTQRKMGHESATARQSLRLAKEVRLIQHRAAERAGGMISIGPLVLFSTDTGDAWILDPADQLAARLAYGGDPLPVHIEENETNYTIGWQGSYRLDGDTFVYEDNQSRRLTAIRGYPVKTLLRTISEADRR